MIIYRIQLDIEDEREIYGWLERKYPAIYSQWIETLKCQLDYTMRYFDRFPKKKVRKLHPYPKNPKE